MSKLQVLEEERRKLLVQEQNLINLIASHNEELVEARGKLSSLDNQISRLKQSQKAKESDSWKCLCGEMLKGDRKRCGSCRRWRGGKRGSGSNPPMIQRVVSSNDEEAVDMELPRTRRKRGRKSSGDDSISAVSIDDEQAAASRKRMTTLQRRDKRLRKLAEAEIELGYKALGLGLRHHSTA